MKRKTDNFDKFYNRKRNSAIKEEFKQEKRTARKERQTAVDRHFEEQRRQRTANAGQSGRAPNPFVERQTADKKNQRADTGKKEIARKLIKKEKAPAAEQANRQTDADAIPLNKFIAHAGVASRRHAAEFVKEGRITVNGKPVTDPGTRVSLSDTVKLNGKKISVSSHFVYILLNKPKDFLTTTSDPQGRKTVLQLIASATKERVYPIGRLDRNTSGVLLFTNDGDLSQKLSHPKNEVKKVYHVGLDKELTKADFEKILNGVELEDGIARADVLAYADAKDRTQVGLEIHSGKNRIVRRIFESLGYDVRTLDRVMYAGLTKKNVPRGKWRFLTDKEIRILKYLKS
ncbi:MAG TPA: pseudouridine synthase [Puia sp.]|nr:pseudouridine synthase [Puia sp.]